MGTAGAEDTARRPDRATQRARGLGEQGPRHADSQEELSEVTSPLRNPSNNVTDLTVLYSSLGSFLEPYF